MSNNIYTSEPPICSNVDCKNAVSLRSRGNKWKLYCSKECKYKCTQNKRETTNLEKYGSKTTFNNAEIKNKCKQTLLLNYGVDVPRKSTELNNKAIDTCNIKYGGNAPLSSKEIYTKMQNTCIDNFGFPFHNQSENGKLIRKETCIKKYGVSSYSKTPEYKDKFKHTCLEKYGVEYPAKSEEILTKMQTTCIEKYGVPNPLQNHVIQKKSIEKGKNKPYTLPSGKLIKIQGSEDKTLDMLLTMYTEAEIEIESCGNVPVIDYINELGKHSKYYPDFYIPKDNLIIESKGSYWFNKYKEKNLLKEKACINAGFNYQIIIY